MRPMRAASVLILLAALTAPAPAPSDEASARRLMETAIAHDAAGQHVQAVAELTQVIASGALSPADAARAYYDRGVANDAAGNLTAALQDYGEALRRDPALAPAYNNRANIARRTGRHADAKKDYQSALNCPDGAREYPYFGLGLIAQAEGDGAAAATFYRKALSANPAFAPASQALAALEGPVPKDQSATNNQIIAPTGGKPQNTPAPVQPVPPATTIKPAAAVLIQFGAYGSEALAVSAWGPIAAAFPEQLKGLTPLTEAVERPGKGRLWRLRAAVPGKPAGRSICAALTARGQACILVR